MKSNKLLSSLSDSLEAIAFQTNTRLLDELAQSVNDIRVALTAGTTASKAIANISASVRKHTGMSVSTQIPGGSMSASTMVAPISRNSPLHSDTVKGIMRITSPAQTLRKMTTVGTVDLRTGRVGGVFSTVPPTDMLIGEMLFTKDLLSDHEIAAVMLHELGHLFTYFYTLSKSYRTNYILDQLARYPDMDRTVQIEFLDVVREVTKVDIKDDVDPKVLSVEIVADNVREIQRDLGTKYLDNQLTEILSDQYATRFGAGVHLTMALDKIGRDAGFMAQQAQYRSTAGALVGISLSTVFTLLPIMSVSKFLSMGGFGAYMTYTLTSPGNFVRAMRLTATLAAVGSVMKMMFQVPVTMTPEERYIYIRNDLITLLKDRTLHKDIVRSTLEDINDINELIADLNKLKSLSTLVNDTVYELVTGSSGAKKFSSRLETLANNQLFAQAAALQLNGETNVS